MKRLFSFTIYILFTFLVLFSAGGCRRARPVRVEGKITVTSLIFPSYDFVRAIAGDRVNLVLLTSPGAESHSFEPSPRDIITIRESDLFIYPGSESSKWMERILESLDSQSVKILKLVDLVDAVKEELVEGMEDDDHDHGHEDEDDHHDDYDDRLSTIQLSDVSGIQRALDEHVWTSPKNAMLIVAGITEALSELDSANADFYRQNAAEYSARLGELDSAFRAVIEGAKRNTFIFGDRFPFRYLADAYALEYFAAFPGCSTETEPSATTVAFLINKVRSENIPVIFHIELSNEKIADAISEATGAKKLLLHSAQNVSMREFNNGTGYLDLQKNNVDHLKEALW